MNKRTALLMIACFGFGSSAAANSITYILDINDTASTYNVYGAATGDNFGIAQFAFELIDADTIVNEAPVVGFSPDVGGPLGFNFTRTPTDVSPVGGAQDTSNAAANLVTGIGRESGDLDPNNNGFNTINPQYGGVPLMTDAGTFDNPVLLASGTFTGEATPTFGQLSGLVFTTPDPVGGQPGIAQPPEFISIGGPPPPPPPLPDAEILVDSGTIAMHQFEATGPENDPFCANCTWSDLVLEMGSPVLAPTLSPDGKFVWDTTGSPNGTGANPRTPSVYQWQATVTAADQTTGTALLRVNVIPEPATVAMIGLAMLGLGFVRRH